MMVNTSRTYLLEVAVHYNIDVVQRGCEGMVVGIFWKWPFVFHWPIFLLLQAPSLLVLSLPLVLALLSLNPHSGVVLLVSCLIYIRPPLNLPTLGTYGLSCRTCLCFDILFVEAHTKTRS